MRQEPCPEVRVLEQFMVGNVAQSMAARLEEHFQDCPECLETLNGLKVDDSLVDAVAAAPQAEAAAPRTELVNDLIERVCAATASTPGQEVPTAPFATGHKGLLAPPQGPDELGRLARYRVLKELGAGGMGIVFAAEDTVLRRQVALKVMRPDLAAKPEAKGRFLREAQAMAALQHDHVVAVHDVGEDRGVPYLAMQFLKGMTLADWLKKNPRLSVPQVLKLGREAALGLAAAHQKGLIHRDIKPANLWLEAPKGRVKLLDFGLAKADREAALLTQEGDLLGTPAYMAPEQARGDMVDARADLFSLGCVLYQACTGTQPFPGTNLAQVMCAVTTKEPVPVRDANPDVPPELAALVMKMLAKNPAARPASATAVATELERLIHAPSQPAEPAPDKPAASPLGEGKRPPRTRRPLLIAAGLFFCGLLVWGAYEIIIEITDANGNKTTIIPPPKSTVRVVDIGNAYKKETPPDAPPRHIGTPRTVTPSSTASRPKDPPRTVTPLGKVPPNSIGMVLVPIQSGKFVMGSRDNRPQYDLHDVEITRPFYMGAHEVTVGQFKKFIEEKGYKTTAERDGGAERLGANSGFHHDPQANWRNPGNEEQTDNHPVTCVSWDDAMEFCKWLSQKEGRTYRLPTEAEWEYAARAGTTTRYHFGDDPKDLPLYAWYYGNSRMRTNAVGQRKPNPKGLYDMYGNVWEWCADWLDADYYQFSPPQDPPGPARSPHNTRVMRGGTWFQNPPECGSDLRTGLPHGARRSNVGFRVMCEVSTEKAIQK